jgi:superfamily II DNA/RNA helicase
MSFKKIAPRVAEALQVAEITHLSEFGQQLFSAVKSGVHIFALAPIKSGKTTAALVTCFNKVNQQLDGAPRILYVCGSIDAAIGVHERMTPIATKLDVTLDLVHDKGDMVLQRNNIFNGTEIIVGTIKRIFDLYVQNGINVQTLDYIIFDDFDEILTQGKVMEVKRLIEGVQKTQIICLANEKNQRVSYFLESAPLDFKVFEEE